MSEERYRIRIEALRDPVDASRAVADALRIDLPTAARLCMSAPGTLVEDVSPADAEHVVSYLSAAGLLVWAEPMAAPRAFGSGPAPAESATTGPGDAFWPQAPVAFLAPFLGRGWLLLVAAGAAGCGALASLYFALGLFKLLGGAFMLLVTVGLFLQAFNQLAQAALSRADDAWLPEPLSALPSMAELFYRGLLLLALGFVVFGLRWALTEMLDSPALRIVVPVLALLYWPMALTVVSVSGRPLGVFNVVQVVRGVFVAPLEYLVACVLTLGTALTMTVFAVVTLGVGVSLARVSIAVDDKIGVEMAVVFLQCAAYAYFHGVMGYLMGALVRSKYDRFAFLTAD